MELVKADREDVDALAERWFSLASEMERYSALNDLAVELPAEASGGFERQLDSDDTAVYLIEAEGSTVGYLTLRTGERPSRERSRYATVVDLFVDPAHRNRGHGSEAIQAAKRIAAERGAEYVTVSCEWGNDDARRFYEECGFEEKRVTFAQRLDAEDG